MNSCIDNLEIAALPTTTPEERDRLLSFVICGGGPTGVETASEIYDMVNEDVLEYVRLISLSSHLSNVEADERNDMRLLVSLHAL